MLVEGRTDGLVEMLEASIKERHVCRTKSNPISVPISSNPMDFQCSRKVSEHVKLYSTPCMDFEGVFSS